MALADSACAFLVGTIVHDLDLLEDFPEVPADLPEFFAGIPIERLTLAGVDFLALFERLLALKPDADTYFACLAKLHKSRLKYQRILETQPLPTMEQVGPRGLLQYGTLTPTALVALLYWRKWMFDIDNRAGQETGYLFEPIIASAIGGVAVSASRSPIRRRDAKAKGRQVDCIKGDRAYEFKIRLTIAASGQGRWREELDFPLDCKESGFIPILVVLDRTPNPKLTQLSEAFLSAGGEVYTGDDAWRHLETAAGPTMAIFLEKYVRTPLRSLLEAAHRPLPDLTIRDAGDELVLTLGTESLTLSRRDTDLYADEEELPEDVDEDAGGP
jgi:hypothetical protein